MDNSSSPGSGNGRKSRGSLSPSENKRGLLARRVAHRMLAFFMGDLKCARFVKFCSPMSGVEGKGPLREKKSFFGPEKMRFHKSGFLSLSRLPQRNLFELFFLCYAGRWKKCI